MKRKQPWLPEKPKRAIKCPKCKGEGVRRMMIDLWKDADVKCPDCGGKGFI